jgi:hypothetical protein
MSGEEIAGRYRLVEPLGRGAMSSVWLAEDRELERLVAVKLLSPAADRARFEREARAAASLSHPNLCALYDYGESDGKPYMVLEYLPNGSLEERLKAGRPLPDAETHRVATEIASGLAHAHARDLVHRDLKPANVLFDTEGRAKIADFGIARMGDSGTLTEAGTVLGTASYISPEQASGEPAGPTSDVYSFGVILFRMLTGRLPFTGTGAMEVVRMHRDDPPPSVGELRPDAPAQLASLADAALAKDPARRPAGGAALVSALRGAAGAETLIVAPGAAAVDAAATEVLRPAVLQPAPLRPASPHHARRRSGVVVLALVAALALLGVGVAVAVVTSGGGAGSGAASLPALSLPTVSTIASSSAVTTAASATTAAATTTRPATTAPATTRATVPATTAVATTATVPTTTPATTSAATTTTAVTTDTTPTTTATTTTTASTTTAATP